MSAAHLTVKNANRANQGCYRRRPAFYAGPAFVPDRAFLNFEVEIDPFLCPTFARLFLQAAGRRRRYSKNARLLPDFSTFLQFISKFPENFIVFKENLKNARLLPDIFSKHGEKCPTFARQN